MPKAYINRPGAPVPINARAGNASVVTNGGTAVTAVVGPILGGYIVNPADAAAQGLGATENLYLDMVGTPGSTDSAAHGTALLLAPGQDFVLPALPDGWTVLVNAPSSGHKFSAVVW